VSIFLAFLGIAAFSILLWWALLVWFPHAFFDDEFLP
jgi:hypothetical protein